MFTAILKNDNLLVAQEEPIIHNDPVIWFFKGKIKEVKNPLGGSVLFVEPCDIITALVVDKTPDTTISSIPSYDIELKPNMWAASFGIGYSLELYIKTPDDEYNISAMFDNGKNLDISTKSLRPSQATEGTQVPNVKLQDIEENSYKLAIQVMQPELINTLQAEVANLNEKNRVLAKELKKARGFLKAGIRSTEKLRDMIANNE